MTSNTSKVDFFTGTGLVIFSGTMFAIAADMPKAAKFGLGPGGYPMLVTGVLILLGVILAAQGLIGARRAKQGEASSSVVSLRELRGAAILAASFWAYIILMRYLGFVITTPIFMFLFLLQYGERKRLRMIVISIVTTGICWALFRFLFMIFLPEFYFL